MNRSTKTLIRYEWKAFVRNRFQLLMLAVLFTFGLYAIYYGQSKINAQRDTIQAVTALEEQEFAKYRVSLQQELKTRDEEQAHDIASRPAFAWYRHGYHAILHPHDYAALAIGQRDLFRYYYRLTGMSLYYQLFENELANPVNLMAGNFDLSFVLTYLFPLVIISFCYGLYSVEKENGTLPLLRIQPIPIRKIMLLRLGFYFSIITGLSVILSLIGILLAGGLQSSDNITAGLAWLLSVVSYCAFWFALMFLIVSSRRSSSFNAMTAAACWLLFLIVIPAILNVVVSTKYPLSSATLAGLTRRTGLENEDDPEEAREVIREFLSHKPELAGSDSLLEENMMPKAYAAFTALKDIDGQEAVAHYNTQVLERSRWTSHFLWLSPAVNMQEVLAHIAETDLNTFLRFQDALTAFHGDITDFYFSRLFRGQLLVLEDYRKRPVFELSPTDKRWGTIWWGLGKIFGSAGLVLALGYSRMKAGRLSHQ